MAIEIGAMNIDANKEIKKYGESYIESKLSTIKERYLIKAPYDEDTGKYLLNSDGTSCENDIYIECGTVKDEDMIYEYSNFSTFFKGLDLEYAKQNYTKSKKVREEFELMAEDFVFELYIGNLARGRGILLQLCKDYLNIDTTLKKFQVKPSEPRKSKDDDNIETTDKINYDTLIKHMNAVNNSTNNGICYDIEETKSEILFKFKAKYIDTIAKLAKAKKVKPLTAKQKKKDFIRTAFDDEYLPAFILIKKEEDKKKKLEEARFIVYDKMEKGYWDEMSKDIIPSIRKKYKLDMAQSIKLCYTEFGKAKKKNLLKDADKNNYKINPYIHFLGFWNEFINFSKSLGM